MIVIKIPQTLTALHYSKDISSKTKGNHWKKLTFSLVSLAATSTNTESDEQYDQPNGEDEQEQEIPPLESSSTNC